VSEVTLLVGGRRYGGWKSVRVTRSIESLAGSFALDVSDRWGEQSEPWPITEQDPCRVEIDGTVVIDGYIRTRRLSASATARSLSYTGRDRAADLVDCSAVLSSYTFRNLTIADFAAELARPFNVRVTVQPGLTLARRSKIMVQPGDKAYEAIAREVAEAGVLLVSDAAGGIVITRAGPGAARAASLVEGQNVLAADVEYDGSDRYHRYVVATQVAGTDEAFGDATRVHAEAIDEGVREARVLLIRPDRGYDVAAARRRADWEARIRAARATTVTITVLGWTQPNGTLWPLNALCRVRCPRTIDIDGDALISQVDHTISDAGQVSQLRLVRPDAFTPEPTKATVKTSAAGGWPELVNGGL
jgi:prophage tail gpP-like protein